MLEKKRWRDLVRPGEWHHLAIILFLPGRPSRLHTHDFPELFWIERGQGRHHVNGRTLRLEAGDLIWIRPHDRHVLEATTSEGFVLVNLAYHPRMRAGLLRRHPDEFRRWLASRDPLPPQASLPPEMLKALRRQLDGLSASGGSKLVLEHFLLGLALQLRTETRPASPAAPHWLQQAMERVQRPEYFVQGAPGLVRAAGRSPEHVARTVRQVFDLTPSDYVNRVRMEFAARELRLTARPIADIALACGLNNLSHFYALFRAAHGRSPRTYRLAHQRAVA
jgi:AraC family cel operon transcriptional repressor